MHSLFQFLKLEVSEFPLWSIKYLKFVAPRAIVLCLSGSSLLATPVQAPSSPVVKKEEAGGRNRNDEPVLFSDDSDELTVSASRNLGSAERASRDGQPPDSQDSEEGSFPDEAGHAQIPTDRRDRVLAPNGLGFSASRERDAILARIQKDSTFEPYNIKIGRIPIRLAASLGLEFSDNYTRSKNNQQSELTILPRLDVSSSVKLGTRTTLSLGIGIGYIKYLNNSDSDRFLAVASLSPDTGISLDFKIGKFIVSVYDRPLVPQFQADVATQRNQSQYSQFSNTVGVSVLWNVNSRVSAITRYDHNNYVSLESGKNSTDGATDSFLASLSWQLSEALGVGIQAGGDIRSYESDLLNDGSSYHIGTSLKYTLSRFIQVQGGFGYQGGTYSSGGGIRDNSSLGTYYANLSISNNLNSQFSHSISIGREAQRGAFSNFTISHFVRYQVVWDLVNGMNLNAWTSFEDIEESGGIFAQNFQYFTLGLSCSLRVSSRIGLSLSYAFTRRDADGNSLRQGDALDFTENRFSLNLGYSF